MKRRQRIVKPKRREEETLQTHCVKLLDAYARPDVCYFAVPNGGKRPIKTGVMLKQTGTKKGVADLILLVSSISHALELKTSTGKQSDDQAAWQERWERAGGVYHLACSLAEAIVVLQDRIRAFRPGIKFHSEAMTPA